MPQSEIKEGKRRYLLIFFFGAIGLQFRKNKDIYVCVWGGGVVPKSMDEKL